MKRFNLKCNVGKAKYLVSHHDGIQKHKDGSDFFGIAIFRNKKKLSAYLTKLRGEGYVEVAGI